MAVSLTPNPSRLTLVREVGMTTEGKAILRSQSINNVKEDADNQHLYAIADAIGQLSLHPVVLIQRHDSGILADF